MRSLLHIIPLTLSILLLGSTAWADTVTLVFKEAPSLQGGENVLWKGDTIGTVIAPAKDSPKRISIQLDSLSRNALPVNTYGKIETRDQTRILQLITVHKGGGTLKPDETLKGVSGGLEEASIKASMSLAGGGREATQSVDEVTEPTHDLGKKMHKAGNDAGKAIDKGVKSATSTIEGWFKSKDEKKEEEPSDEEKSAPNPKTE